MKSSSWLADASKTGEIFRNKEGRYVFMCFHCYITLEDFGEIINHCDSHYDYNEKYDIDVQPTEIVFCAEIDSELPSKFTSPTCTSSLTTSEKSGVTNDSRHFTQSVAVRGKKLEKKESRGRKKRIPGLERPQTCPICEVWCDNFRNHIKLVHNMHYRIYQCYMCSKFFPSAFTVRKHISSSVHNKNKTTRESACYHCEMEPPITNPSDARRHKCLFCKQWFANHIEFKTHFRDAHDKDADNFFRRRSNCNIFTCYVCEREFPLRYYLVAHMKTHHEKFLCHQCSFCGIRVRTYGQLTQHLKTHEGKIYPCDQCDKQFAFYARLRFHRLCHKTELNYVCEICSKAFKLKKYLKVHMAVHTSSKKYACKFCPATFNFTSGRRAHEKSQHKTL